MRKLLTVALLSAAAPMHAWAADQGVYLTGDIGAARYQNAAPFPDPAKLGLGAGYRFNKYFAADAGLAIFGRSEASGSRLRANSLHPSLVGILPVTAEISAFGKLGVSRNHAQAENGGINFSTTRTDRYYGLGIAYNVNSKYGFTALYENFGKFDNSSAPIEASAFSIGVIVYMQ